MPIKMMPDHCLDCDTPLYFDVEASVIYCVNACGLEFYIGEDDEEIR